VGRIPARRLCYRTGNASDRRIQQVAQPALEASTMPDPLTTAVSSVPCAGCGCQIDRLLYVGTDYISGGRFPVLACDERGLVRTAGTARDHSEAYSGYYGRRQSAFEPFTNRLRRRRLLRVVRPVRTGAILDVGCGRGGFLLAMRKVGWRVAGVERPVPVYQGVWEAVGLDVSTNEWDRTGHPDASFDVVTLWHVFEHLPAPHQALEIASRLLTDRGTLVIAVPNIAGAQARLFKTRWFHLDVPRHLVHYSLGSLSALLRQHGFAVRSAKNYSFEYDTFGAIQSALNVCCVTQNLLFDLLMRRRTATSILRRADPRELVDLALTALLVGPLTVCAIPLCWMTSWVKRGATIEVYATRTGT
jgi:2-polyprenyl-3-methyl-5-hydroxy-6-metoxy-1,4-benzoquinol methylase